METELSCGRLRAFRRGLLGGLLQGLWIPVFAYTLAAVLNFGVNHWDELFQVVEFSGHKLGLYPAERLPWEFADRIRSWFQPWIYYFFGALTRGLWADDPTRFTTICQVVTGVFFCASFSQFLEVFAPRDPGRLGRLFILTFFSTVFFGVRTSSESFSASLFFLGAIELAQFRKTLGSWLGAGLLLGLSFQARFPMAVCILALLLWTAFHYRKKWPEGWLMLGAGFACSVVIGALFNRLGYGVWVFPEKRYFVANILHDVASGFGTAPFYAYFTMVREFFGQVPALILILSWIYFLARYWRHPLSWCSLAMVAVHSAIPHKELRFLMPVLAWLPLFALTAFQDLLWFAKGRPKGFVWAFRLIAAAALAVLFVANTWGWATRLVLPTEPKFALIRQLHQAGVKEFSYVYTDIDPRTHGSNEFHLYKIPGNSQKMSLEAISQALNSGKLPYSRILVNYDGGRPPTELRALRLKCETWFLDDHAGKFNALRTSLNLAALVPSLWYDYEGLKCR